MAPFALKNIETWSSKSSHRLAGKRTKDSGNGQAQSARRNTDPKQFSLNWETSTNFLLVSVAAAKVRPRIGLKAKDRIGLTVIDCAQLSILHRFHDGRGLTLADMPLGLRLIGNEATIRFIVLSHLSGDNRVRESRNVGQDVETLSILERDAAGLENSNMTVRVVKQRNIPPAPLKLIVKSKRRHITERGVISEDHVPWNANGYPEASTPHND